MRAAGTTICRDSRRSPPATIPGTIHGSNDPTLAWARARKETTDVEDRRDPESGVRVDRGQGCRAIRRLLRALSRRDRDTFDYGPDSAVFVGWPTFALSSARRPDLPPPSPDTTSIQLWWRASDAQALYEQAVADGVPILAEPFDGPFGRTFAMADPDGYRITVYEKDQPLFWPPKRG